MTWMVRNPGGQHAQELLEKGIVGIGWSEVAPNVKGAKSPADFYEVVQKTYPELRGQEIVNAGRQLFKFFREMKVGDRVLTYDSPRRTYHMGTIAGDVQSNPAAPDHLSYTRKVKWQYQVERDRLSQAARNSLGSTLTIFKPSQEALEEIQTLIETPDHEPRLDIVPTADTEAEDPFINALENSRELIKDKITKLSWKDMQVLVAGILRAMGYKTKISQEGGDRGKDVIASPDGLGLTQPRIFVEVKHRKGQMGAPEVRKFIGGRNPQNDRCLFVSTGGFTIEAKYEAERSIAHLTLIDSDDLVELLVEYYEKTDAETRTLVPLRRTYWPA
jgi:restriction system protein